LRSNRRAFRSSDHAFRSNRRAFRSNDHAFRSNRRAFRSSDHAVRSNRPSIRSNCRAVYSNRCAFWPSKRTICSNRSAFYSSQRTICSNERSFPRSRRRFRSNALPDLRAAAARPSTSCAEAMEHGGDAVEELLALLNLPDAHVSPRNGDAQGGADLGIRSGGGGEAGGAIAAIGTGRLPDVESNRAESAADLLAEIAVALPDASDDGPERLDGEDG
jgi:hypothetical protein